MRRQSGFTLIEVMVVVVILGILAAIIVPKIMGRPEQARVVKAKQDILAIQNALDLYKLDNGVYPTTEQGLQALVTSPTSPEAPNWNPDGYLKSIPIDPWGQPYQYENNDGQIRIYSYGSKGQQGGGKQIDNADVGD
jgi:general secretion pathway protein G